MTAFYETLDHTGDTGIRVWGNSWEDLLEKAARAFNDVLTEWEAVGSGSVERRIEVEGEDREELLVAWLAELLYLYDTERLLFGGVAFQETGAGRVRAVLSGEPLDPGRHRIKTEIKAVTHHAARVVTEGDRWTAEVVFDL